ncbi:hypothetical protein T11_5697 [Trichinella zimbabwensis]|uniref:Uncharacterized protein n=1 Tax=Trichinella zimbabwensis TaxID=268475 RepID=A0A0V1DNK0_9BILA|nr:hypothetical protein T11_5697 [Trichinella zimbabwensis]
MNGICSVYFCVNYRCNLNLSAFELMYDLNNVC